MQIETSITPTKKIFEGENGFRVYGAYARKEDDSKIEYNKYGNFTISGDNIPDLTIGMDYEVVIAIDTKSKYPSSYKVLKFGEISLETPELQWSYLKSVVTELQYSNIKRVYRDEDTNIIDMIRDGSFDFMSIPGFGHYTYELMLAKVEANIELSKAMAFFSKYNVSVNSIQKIVSYYGSSEVAIEKVKENPYILVNMSGFGFKKVDEIALNMGIEKDSRHRIKSCIEFVLEEELNSGNTWMNAKSMLDKSITLLEVEREKIEDELSKDNKEFMFINDSYALKIAYEAELYVANEIMRRNSKNALEGENMALKAISEFEDETGMTLSSQQRKFITDFEKNNVSLLIGSAGTGKSQGMKVIKKYSQLANKKLLLLAPTGRASKVLTNYTGQQAFTIHRRILGERKIYDDIILVDEASMADIFIVKALFEAIENPDAKIVFIGDDAQIPSVGAGNFLYDCIQSGVVPMTKLTKVFRQEEGGILDIATKTRNGEKFINSGYNGRRVFGKNCVLESTFGDVGAIVLEDYKKLYKSKKWAPEDIIILTPTNKGELGTLSINNKIQEIVNPSSPMKNEYVLPSRTLRVGDLVMNTINKYDLEVVSDYGIPQMTENGFPESVDVFNGESGKILNINNDEKYMIIDFDDFKVKFTFEDSQSSLLHGWCVTTYKAQGSQYKVVIVLVDKSSTYQMNANLLYTAQSRSMEYLKMVGQAKTINMALNKFANLERKCFLGGLLKELALKEVEPLN